VANSNWLIAITKYAIKLLTKGGANEKIDLSMFVWDIGSDLASFTSDLEIPPKTLLTEAMRPRPKLNACAANLVRLTLFKPPSRETGKEMGKLEGSVVDLVNGKPAGIEKLLIKILLTDPMGYVNIAFLIAAIFVCPSKDPKED